METFFFFLEQDCNEANLQKKKKKKTFQERRLCCTYNRSSCFRSWKAPLSMMLTWLSSRCLESQRQWGGQGQEGLRDPHARPRPCRHRHPLTLGRHLRSAGWDQSGGTREFTSQLGVTVTRVSPPAHFYLTDWFPCLYFRNVLRKCPPKHCRMLHRKGRGGKAASYKNYTYNQHLSLPPGFKNTSPQRAFSAHCLRVS